MSFSDYYISDSQTELGSLYPTSSSGSPLQNTSFENSTIEKVEKIFKDSLELHEKTAEFLKEKGKLYSFRAVLVNIFSEVVSGVTDPEKHSLRNGRCDKGRNSLLQDLGLKKSNLKIKSRNLQEQNLELKNLSRQKKPPEMAESEHAAWSLNLKIQRFKIKQLICKISNQIEEITLLEGRVDRSGLSAFGRH